MIVIACVVFYSIAHLIDFVPTEEYKYNEKDSFQDILDKEDMH